MCVCVWGGGGCNTCVQARVKKPLAVSGSGTPFNCLISQELNNLSSVIHSVQLKVVIECSRTLH